MSGGVDVPHTPCVKPVKCEIIRTGNPGPHWSQVVIPSSKLNQKESLCELEDLLPYVCLAEVEKQLIFFCQKPTFVSALGSSLSYRAV